MLHRQAACANLQLLKRQFLRLIGMLVAIAQPTMNGIGGAKRIWWRQTKLVAPNGFCDAGTHTNRSS